MNEEIGTVAAQFLFWEYLFRIFSVLVVCSADQFYNMILLYICCFKEHFLRKKQLALYFLKKKNLVCIFVFCYSCTERYFPSKKL
jgi:hypothetical protein